MSDLDKQKIKSELTNLIDLSTTHQNLLKSLEVSKDAEEKEAISNQIRKITEKEVEIIETLISFSRNLPLVEKIREMSGKYNELIEEFRYATEEKKLIELSNNINQTTEEWSNLFNQLLKELIQNAQ